MAVTCVNVDNGWNEGCLDNFNGVRRILIKSFDKAQEYTYNTAGLITAASIVETVFEIEQTNESAEFITGEGAHSYENGTNVYTQTLNMVFHKYQSKLRDLVCSLATGLTIAYVQTNSGDWFIFGEETGGNVTASSSTIGKTYDSMSGTTLTLSSKGRCSARQVLPAYAEALTINPTV